MEDIKTTEIIVEEPAGNLDRERLKERLKMALPEEKHSDNVEQMALAYMDEQQEMNDRLVARMAEEPEMADALVAIMNGGKSSTALIRALGKDFFGAKEGTPEYEELMRAHEEFTAERAKMRADSEELDAKLANFFAKLREYCEKHGLDYDDYVNRIMEAYLAPLLDVEATDAVFDRLVKGVDYDKDTEDAFAAGVVKGRNTNIHELRVKPDDGLPKGLTSTATPAERAKRPINPLIAKALEA